MNFRPSIQPLLALNSPFINFPMQLTNANDTVISLSGRLLQIEIRHQPQHQYQDQSNKDYSTVRAFRQVTKPKAAKPKVERTKFILLDESFGEIQFITLDPSRRVVCICASEGSFPKFHLYAIATQQKLAVFGVQENANYLNSKVISVSISSNMRWLAAQMNGNDFPLLAWSIPLSVSDQTTAPLEKYMVYSTTKHTHLFKIQHEVNLIQFSIVQPELILISGTAFYNIFMVSDSAIRLAAQISIKRLINSFSQIYQTLNYTYAVVGELCEILVLKGEVLVSFLFSEALFNPKGQRVQSTCKPAQKFQTIRNHVEFEGDKFVDEGISKIAVLDDKYLFVGSTRGRMLVYQIMKLDDKVMQQYPCRTTGGTNLNVIEVTLVISMLLPFDNPIVSIDLLSGLVLVQQKNNQCYISNQLTVDKLDKLVSYQNGQSPDNQNLILQSAFDSVVKLMRLIKDPQHIKLNSEELFLLNPLKQTSKINIQGADNLDKFEYLAFQDPGNWPYALFCPSLKCPLISTMQTISTVLRNVDQLTIHNQIISPTEHFSGFQMGKQFYYANDIITGVTSSEEANLVAFGDINGVVKIFDLTTQIPYCVWNWKMPSYVKYEESYGEDGEEDLNDGNTRYAGSTGPGGNLMTTRTGATGISQSTKYQGKAGAAKRADGDQFDENDFSKRDYSITCLRMHTSGLHLIIGGQCKDPKYVKFFNTLLVCHLLQGDIEVSLILEFNSKIIQIEFDQQGNFLYVMDQQSLSVFSFYEMRLITKLDFNLRLKHINDSFSPEFKHYQDEFNKSLNSQALPLLFKIHESSGYLLVSFDDGDLVVFNSFCNKLMFKYLINGKNQIKRHVVDFEILSVSDYDQGQMALYKQNDQVFQFLPLIVLYSDSQVVTMNMGGHEIIICNKGLNNINGVITKIKLTHGFQQFNEWDKFRKTTQAMKDDSLINAMLFNAVKTTSPRQWILCVGEKGALQIVPLPAIQKEATYSVQFHNTSIKFLELIRDNEIVTVSEDQQIVISSLKFGPISVSRPVPKAAIWSSQTIRSKQLQESLDLLLFEILNKSFMMRQESEVSIRKLQLESEQQITKLYTDYQMLKNQVIRQLNDEQIALQGAEQEYIQKKATQDQKAKVLSEELNHSYTEQLNILKQENEKLNKELMETKLAGENQVNAYNAETKTLVDEFQTKTNKKLLEMDDIITNLNQDKASLTSLSEAQIKKASEDLEQEITILYKLANDAEKSESATVIDLRNQHKKLEGQFMLLQKDFADLKTQLNKQKNQIQFQEKELQYKKDQLQQVKNEIVEKENVEKMKIMSIRQMQDEKEDLLKLKQLLNQRVSDLKKQVAPRDDMIADLQTQVQDMDSELFKDALKQKNADMVIQDSKQKKQSLLKTIEEKERNITETEQAMKEMLTDVQNFCFKYLNHIGIKPQNVHKQIDQIQVPLSLDQAHKDYATALKVIYSKHVDKSLASQLQGRLMSNNIADNVENAENQRIQKINEILGTNKIKLISKSQKQTETPTIAKQREYLEKSVVTLEKSLARRRIQLNQAIEKARQQSSTLLSFSNLMRRENKTLQQRLRAAKLELIKKKQEMGILQEQLFGPALEALLEQENDAPETIQISKPAPANQQDQVLALVEDEFKNANMDKYLEENFPLPPVPGSDMMLSGQAGSKAPELPSDVKLPKIPKK